jgi:uncharacterized membrane protein
MINLERIIKSLIYRLYASIITVIIIFIITNNWILSTTIGVVDSIIKIITYYGFETLWEKYFKKLKWKKN